MEQEYNFPDNMDDSQEKDPFDLFNSDFDQEEKSAQKNRSYYCTFPGCGKAFRFKSEISRHSVVHLSDRSYPCDRPGCKKAFKRFDALETHIKTHAKNKRFSCDYEDCNQKFASKAGLKYHLLKHRNELPYKCTFSSCEKSFLTAACLAKHLKSGLSHAKISKQKDFAEENSNNDNIFENFVSGSDSEEVTKERHTNRQSYEPSSDESTQEQVQKLLESILKENQMMKDSLKRMESSHSGSKIAQEIDYKESSSPIDSSVMERIAPDSPLFDFFKENKHDFSNDY